MKKRWLCLFIVNMIGIVLLTGCVGTHSSESDHSQSEDFAHEMKFEDGKYFMDVTLGDTQEDVLASLGQPDVIIDRPDGALSYYRYDGVEWHGYVGDVLIYWENQVPGVSNIRWVCKSTDEREIRNLNKSIENELKKNFEKVDHMSPDTIRNKGKSEFFDAPDVPIGVSYRKDNIEFFVKDGKLDSMNKTEGGQNLYTASLSVRYYSTPYVISDDMHFLTVSDNSDIAIVTDPSGKIFARRQVYPKQFVLLHEAEYTMRRKIGKNENLQWDSNKFHIIDINDQSDVEINIAEKMIESGLMKESWQMDPDFTPTLITLNNNGQKVPCLEIKCIDTSSEEDFQDIRYVDLIIDGIDVTATASLSSLISPIKDKVEPEEWQTQIAAIKQYLKDSHCYVEQSDDMPGSSAVTSVLGMYSAICEPSNLAGTLLIQLPVAALDTSAPTFLEKFPDFADYEWNEDDVLTLYINDYPSADDIEQFLTFKDYD